MKQSRNQYTGAAGITQREANSIRSATRKLFQISQKKNLFVKYQLRLVKATEQLVKLLEEADR